MADRPASGKNTNVAFCLSGDMMEFANSRLKVIKE
jgi:hypothetical protein